MKNLGRSKAVIVTRLFIAAGLILNTRLALVAWAQSRDIRSQDLYDQTLEGLQTAMDAAQEDNTSSAERNRKLQDTIDALSQQIDNSHDELMDLKREAYRLADEITLTDKEQKLMKARYEVLQTEKTQLNNVNAGLRQQLGMFDKDNQDTFNDVKSLQANVQEIRTSLPKANIPTGRQKRAQTFELAQLSLQDRKNEDLKNQINKAQGVYQKYSQSQKQIEEQNDDLKNQLARNENDLENVQGQAGLYAREALAQAGGIEKSQPQDNESFKSYVKELRKSINDLRTANRSVQGQGDQQTKNLAKELQLTQNLQIALKKQVQASGESLDDSGDNEDEIKTLQERKAELLNQQKNLQAKIGHVQDQMSDKHPKKDIAASKELIKKLSESSARIQDLKTKIEYAKPQSFGSGNGENQLLTQQAAILEKQLNTLRSAPVVPDKPSNQETTKQIEELKASIAQLETSRSILNSSLKAISSKYNIKELTGSDQGTQEAQLIEYLKVLTTENQALQERFLNLQMKAEKKQVQEP